MVDDPGLAFLRNAKEFSAFCGGSHRETASWKTRKGDVANLDVGTRALSDGAGDEREEDLDGGAAQGGWISAEERRGEGGFCYCQFWRRHLGRLELRRADVLKYTKGSKV